MKLLHSADWQIGKQFGQFDADDAVLLAEARFAVVERLAALAVAHGVQAVLVAGDVFDAQGVSDKTIHRLFNAMAGFAGPWVLIPGNHDAALAESVWTRARRLQAVPAHVHLCLSPEPLLLPDIGLAVLPAPLTQRITHVDLTHWFASAVVPAGLRKVGLAHGSVQGLLAESMDAGNPIAPGRAQQAGLDYLALGDWHGTRQVDSHTWYSGTPETDRFRANASGQALLVTLAEPGDLGRAGHDVDDGDDGNGGNDSEPGDPSDPGDPGDPGDPRHSAEGQGTGRAADAGHRASRHAAPQVTPLATGHYRWQSLAAVLQVPSDLDGLLQQLAALGAQDVLSLEVSGQTDLAGQRRLLEAIGQARGRARGLLVELAALRLEPTDADLAALQADGYLGEVVAELRAAQADIHADIHADSHADSHADRARLARDALALLAALLVERRSGAAPAAANAVSGAP